MEKIKRFFKYLKYFLLSKYCFAVIFLLFFIWLIFFDKNSIKEQKQLATENTELRKEIEENRKIISEYKFKIKALSDSLEVIEKYAREHYQMKAENETVYLIDK